MANWFRSTTIQALEDVSGSQYCAFAVVDGKLANTAEEATGILMSKTENNQHATIGYIGEMFYQAGAAITLGAKLTVTTSGYFTTAGSDSTVIGEAKDNVTSGSVGTGLFAFSAATGKPNAIDYTVTAEDEILAGYAYTTVDNKLANTGLEMVGISESGITSGSTGQITVAGVVAATFADSYGPGISLVCTSSGYMTVLTSGDTANAVTLAGALSGTQGDVVVVPGYFLTA